MARCLELSLERDTTLVVTNGIQVRVDARNRCDHSFAPGDVRVEARAIPRRGGGIAGHYIGQFQTTIGPWGAARTFLVIPCDPEGDYRLEVRLVK